MVVHIGANDGSHQNNTVKALRKHGIECIGITFYYSEKQETDNIFCFKKWQFILYYLTFFYFALRADLVHLWSEQIPFIVPYLKLIDKPYVVEWTGSDIRNPNLALMDSVNTYVIGDPTRHAKNINKFRDVLNISSSQILIDHLPYSNKAYIPHRLDLDRFKFNPTVHSPLRVAHCTSHREAKGTDKIIDAIGRAFYGEPHKPKIDFRLIENVSREEAIRQVAECDIVIGQMVWGEHGTQELESIAMGKPVLCYISHNKHHPVTNCKPSEIVRWIEYFLEYPEQVKSLAVFQFNQMEDGINIYIDLLTTSK